MPGTTKGTNAGKGGKPLGPKALWRQKARRKPSGVPGHPMVKGPSRKSHHQGMTA